MTEELNLQINDLQLILEAKEPALKLDQLIFELKNKVSYTTGESLSEESLNEIPNRIKELEEELLETYKKSPRLIKMTEEYRNYNRLVEILKNDPILVEKILNEIDNNQ